MLSLCLLVEVVENVLADEHVVRDVVNLFLICSLISAAFGVLICPLALQCCVLKKVGDADPVYLLLEAVTVCSLLWILVTCTMQIYLN